ncbi:MAG: tetratricopeptide repeat protein [Gammaproteobacteria bacterium]|nr:tetratricopeptide repeat protein [Gammaproteobacteria bacterium]
MTPSVFTAQLRIAGVLRDRGDHEAALDHLASLVPVSREEEVDLLLTREQVLREMGRPEEAIELIDGALGEVPDDPDLLYSRGLLAAELSRLDLHEKDMRRVIELDPNNAHAYNALGYTLADQTERYEEAPELITRALELAPDDPFILDSMGWVQYRLGDLDQAEQYLRRALDLRTDAEIAAHLGEVLWAAGIRDEARRLWDEALRIDPDNRTLLRTLERFTGQ